MPPVTASTPIHTMDLSCNHSQGYRSVHTRTHIRTYTIGQVTESVEVGGLEPGMMHTLYTKYNTCRTYGE